MNEPNNEMHRRLERVPRTGQSEQAWEVNRRNLRIVMAQLQNQLVERASYDSIQDRGRKRTWPDVESEQHVVARLAELVAFLGDPSACHDLGIEY